MYKKAALIVLLGLLLTVHGYAAEQIRQITAYLNQEIHVIVNGKFVQLDHPVVIVDNRSYLPLAELGELLDAEVQWDDETKTILISNQKDEEEEEDEDSKVDDDDKNGDKDKNGEEDEEDLVQVASEIRLMGLSHYKITYAGKEHSVLAASYRDKIYFRLTDLQRAGVPLTNASVYRDIFTKKLFVDLEDIKGELDDVRVNPGFEPLVIGSITQKQIDLLLEELRYLDYYEEVKQFTVYTIEQTGNNAYKLLCLEARGQYAYIDVTMRKNEFQEWYIGTLEVEYLNDWEDLYEEYLDE